MHTLENWATKELREIHAKLAILTDDFVRAYQGTMPSISELGDFAIKEARLNGKIEALESLLRRIKCLKKGG